MLTLAYHGGCCCGIKVIHGFIDGPKTIEPELMSSAVIPNHDVCGGGGVTPGTRFFGEAAPEETTLERLDRYIEYVKKRRPKHIIEVVLAEGTYFTQNSRWAPLLKKRRFKCVTKAKNSNSGNTVYVYHKIIDEE